MTNLENSRIGGRPAERPDSRPVGRMTRRVHARARLVARAGLVVACAGGLAGGLASGCAGGFADGGAVGAQLDEAARRAAMVEQQLRTRGLRDERVLAAMGRVPRHRFVPEAVRDSAYADHPLPIGLGQTISQPYIVGYMTEAVALEPTDRVLEIGTGSGYQAAVLAELVERVYTIEIVPDLAERARTTLAELGYTNVEVRTGNGYLGWPEHAPFDAIVVTAAPDAIPPALVEQLALGARMAIPVGEAYQEMMIVTRTPEGVVETAMFPVRFVPMTGKPRE